MNLRIQRADLFCACLVVGLSLAQFRTFSLMHYGHFDTLVEQARAVLIGRPEWIAFQNRLLGPYTVLLISKSGLSFTNALHLFNFFGILAENLLLYGLLRALGLHGRAGCLAWTAVFSLFFLCFQDPVWFYTWDSYDILIFTVFSYLVVSRRPIGWFVALFVVSLFNRESALFVGFYIAFSTLRVDWRRPSLSLDWRRFGLGILLMAAGSAYTKFVRTRLFVATTQGATDAENQALGNHIHLPFNLHNLFVENWRTAGLVNTLWVLGTCALVMWLLPKFDRARQELGLMYLLLIVNIAIFGFVNEERMYLMTLPLLVFAFVGFDFARAPEGGRVRP